MSSTIENTQQCINNEVTTLAMCWQLRLRNGRKLGFTNHDQDLLIGGVGDKDKTDKTNVMRYFASSGFNASAISGDTSLAVDSLDIEGMVDHELITEADIMSGLYDRAEVRVFMVNYMMPNNGIIKLRRGWLGEVRLNRNQFVAEVRGLLQAFTTQLGEIYSPNCRANFADHRCKMDLLKYKMDKLIVQDVIDRSSFVFRVVDDSFDEKNIQEQKQQNKQLHKQPEFQWSRFSCGLLTFVSGLNNGLNMEIKYCADSKLQLVLPMPYNIIVGDMFSMIAGCNKTFKMCSEIYKNALNFRGEPHVPNNTRHG